MSHGITFTHTLVFWGEMVFCSVKNREDWCRAATRAARGEEAFSIHPAARFVDPSVLGDTVP